MKDFLGIPISDPNVAAAHAVPMRPMADGHAIISRGHEALNALGQFLGSHAKGAAAGLHGKPAIYETPEGSANVAAGYQSPTTTARETADLAAQHAQEIANIKGEYGNEQAAIRVRGIRGTLNNAGALNLESATQLNSLGQNFTDFATGKQIDLDALHERMPDAKLVPYMQGQNLLGYLVADQKGHIFTADNMKKVAGEFGDLEHKPTLGQAVTPIERASTATAGNGQQVLTGTSTVTRGTPANAVLPPPAPTAPPAPLAPGATPTLQRRQPVAAAAASPLTDVNAGIAAANLTSPKLNKGKVAPTSKFAPAVPGTIPPEIAAKGVLPDINAMTPSNRIAATKAQPAVAAMLGLYGDPQNPDVKSIADFASLANSPHAQKVLGAAFKLLDEKLGTVKDPGLLATLANASGWENYKAEVEAGVQQRAGSAMTSQEKEYFDYALAGLADIIGTRGATGQSAAKFSVNAIQNEFPLIGTSSVTDKNSYITKMQTVSRNIRIGLNSMPDNTRALKWLDYRSKELEGQKDKKAAQAGQPVSSKAISGPTASDRPPGVPANYVHRDTPQPGWYKP